MRSFIFAFIVIAAAMIIPPIVSAQETETKVVDEVVAVVNDGVITLSGIRREMKAYVDEKVQNGMDRNEAQRQIEEKRGELIADLINQELLVQKAKELGIDSEVEAAINARQLDIMRQYNMRTVEELYETMRKQGVDPDDIKNVWRKQILKERVIAREVSGKLYWKFTSKEIKDYYEKNKAKFAKPETISISEIFLGFAGRDPAAVRETAKTVLSRARKGEDFAALVTEYSDRPEAAASKGKVENIVVSELNLTYVSALKDLKVGDISEPIEVNDTGISIIKVDERSAASSESKFDEAAIRMEMMKEKLPEAQKTFFADLRKDSFIKINESYRPLVSPLLYADERNEKTSN